MTRTLALRSHSRLLLVAILAFAIGGLAMLLAPAAHTDDSVHASARANRANFHDAMRELWEDHIVWTRMVIVSAVDDLRDLPVAVDRLLRNHRRRHQALLRRRGRRRAEPTAARAHRRRRRSVGGGQARRPGGDRGRQRSVVCQRRRDRGLPEHGQPAPLAARGDAA